VRFRIPFIVLITALTAIAPRATSHPLNDAPDCEVFPADNPWNMRVDDLPVATRSDKIIRSIGRHDTLHADFGSGKWDGGPIGIPYITVGSDQDTIPVEFGYADESDPGPYPIPPDAPIEGGSDSDGDRHVIVVDRDACMLYELYAAYPKDDGSRWAAGSGALWDMTSNELRPKTWTSADAAGLPILPGLARYEEFALGKIDHALRFTVSETRRHFIYPARHFASDSDSRRLPAMGQRLRLKAGFDISGFPPQARVVLKALKRYGMIVADNGSDWYISGAPDESWDNDDLHTLGEVTGRHFEVVVTKSLRPVDG
jgi:hypothetical protein